MKPPARAAAERVVESKPAPSAATVNEPAAATVPQVSAADAMQAIVNDPAVKKAMEVFHARIIHVEPRRK